MVTAELFTTLRKEVARLKPVYDLGYVTEINANALVVAGLSKVARQGDEVSFSAEHGQNHHGEITRLSTDTVTIMPYGSLDGVAIGTPVKLLGAPLLAPATAGLATCWTRSVSRWMAQRSEWAPCQNPSTRPRPPRTRVRSWANGSRPGSASWTPFSP